MKQAEKQVSAAPADVTRITGHVGDPYAAQPSAQDQGRLFRRGEVRRLEIIGRAESMPTAAAAENEPPKFLGSTRQRQCHWKQLSRPMTCKLEFLICNTSTCEFAYM